MILTDKAVNLYKDRFIAMAINPLQSEEIQQQIKKIISGMARYRKFIISNHYSIPWFFIGIIHSMECDCNFNQHLHNGNSLNSKTIDVPSGRPLTGTAPFTFEASAKDCVEYKDWDKVGKWDIAQMLFQFERNNGFGYSMRDVPSPYVWSGSNQYSKGKFIADHVYDAKAVSKQIGAAILLKHFLS